MSLFNKPKRNIRRRLEEPDDNDETDNDPPEEIPVPKPPSLSKPKKEAKETKQHKQTLLSFGEELDEADDGEVFRVKKTSRSKKLSKQLDQQRKRKKGDKHHPGNPDDPSGFNSATFKEKEVEIKTDDLVVKVKNTQPTILYGRDALIAGKDDYSSEDEPEPLVKSHPFVPKDDISFRIQSGVIPDAATIHEARKKRQKMREQGSADFISTEDLQQQAQQTESKNRLIREEDDDHSDDNSQNRIDMTIDKEARDRERRRQVFHDTQDASDNDEDEQGEWEVQQIRKAVTGNQHQILFNAPPIAPPPPTIQPPDPSKTVAMAPEEIMTKMRNRLSGLREVHQRSESDLHLVEQELSQSKIELESGETKAPDLAEKFRFYQELRGYINDLVECLDLKLPTIEQLEKNFLELYGDRAAELQERRRQDTRDQAEEVTLLAKGLPLSKEPARTRRATEREGRRARRRRARELDQGKHMDGMSSDDETTEHQNLLFRQRRDEIADRTEEVFNDVVEDFCTIRGVLSRMEDWKETDLESYQEAFATLCIPKMISPLIRLQLVTWNPMQENADVERSKWYNQLITYALKINETEESFKVDPDVKLIPLTMEKVLVPKLTTIVEKIYDPMSTSQTLKLINLVSRLVADYPTLDEFSKPLEALFAAVFGKIQAAVDHDVFIPIFPKHILDPKHAFFQRQFSMAIKLLRNILSWQGLLGDTKLKNVALGSLMNRYILNGMRILHTIEAIKKADMIAKILPRAWLQGENVEHFKSFADLVRKLTDQIDQADPAHNEAWDISKSLLNKGFIKKNL